VNNPCEQILFPHRKSTLKCTLANYIQYDDDDDVYLCRISTTGLQNLLSIFERKTHRVVYTQYNGYLLGLRCIYIYMYIYTYDVHSHEYICKYTYKCVHIHKYTYVGPQSYICMYT
jgi:hypothetical protein